VVHELRREDDEAAARAVKRSCYLLLRHGARLDTRENGQLRAIARTCRFLHRAWTLKEMRDHILELPSWGLARRYLRQLTARMARSRLSPFVPLGRTLRQHAEAIVASIEHCLSNGPIEGCTRKIRGLLFRSFGYRSPDNLVAAIFLNCAGFTCREHSHARRSLQARAPKRTETVSEL
jgi:transposase